MLSVPQGSKFKESYTVFPNLLSRLFDLKPISRTG